MIRLSQVVGQRVLTRGSGQHLGSIRRLLLDTGRGAVTAAELEGGISASSIIDWASVVAIGPDAVMVEDEDAARDAREGVERRFVDGQLELVGKLVLSDTGDALGELEDLEFDEQSGAVARLHVPGHALPARFVALGPDALIIADTKATSSAASAR